MSRKERSGGTEAMPRVYRSPGGQLKFLHLWPGQIPPGTTTGTRGLLLGMVALYKAVGGLFESIAFAPKFDQHTAVHQPV
jgi:hypothetical protein